MGNVKITVSSGDYSKVSNIMPCLEQTIQSAVIDSLEIVRQKWIEEAKAKLRTGRAEYIAGLGEDSIQISSDGLSGSVVLTGDFAKKLEQGTPPYDLKEIFARSNKVKHGKNGGWYIDIPMRQGTPNSVNFSSKIAPGVYTRAKKLPEWGRMGNTINNVQTSWAGYRHKNDVSSGLTKIPYQQGSRSLNTYMVWRRVSENSDPSSWMHP
jgi:hypothetical protein